MMFYVEQTSPAIIAYPGASHPSTESSMDAFIYLFWALFYQHKASIKALCTDKY